MQMLSLSAYFLAYMKSSVGLGQFMNNIGIMLAPTMWSLIKVYSILGQNGANEAKEPPNQEGNWIENWWRRLQRKNYSGRKQYWREIREGEIIHTALCQTQRHLRLTIDSSESMREIANSLMESFTNVKNMRIRAKMSLGKGMFSSQETVWQVRPLTVMSQIFIIKLSHVNPSI